MKYPKFIIFASSRPKDDPKPSNQLIGKWNGVKQYGEVSQNGKVIDSGTILLTAPDYFTFEFKKGNTFAVNSSIQGEEDHESGYYKIQGNHILLGGTADDPDKETYTYQLRENSLILSDSGSDTLNNEVYDYVENVFFEKQ